VEGEVRAPSIARTATASSGSGACGELRDLADVVQLEETMRDTIRWLIAEGHLEQAWAPAVR
jgi:hypothetical protein